MKKKIIIDCDPGHDDAVAIMLAAAHDSIDILGITCVAGNSTLFNTKINALKICSLIGRMDIPIFAGADKPLKYDLVTAEHVHGKSGLDNDGEQIIVDQTELINEFGLLRNQFLGVLKALEAKQFQINNIVKLRVAGLEDSEINMFYGNPNK